MFLNERLIQVLEEQGISISELSRRTGISRLSLRRMVKGETKEPKRKNTASVAAAVGRHPSFFWSDW